MRGLLSETVNHKLSAEGIILWVPTLGQWVMVVPGAKKSAEAQHSVDNSATGLFNHEARDCTDLLVVGAIDSRSLTAWRSDGSLAPRFGTTSAISMIVRMIKPVAIVTMKIRCILANAAPKH